MVVQTAQEMGYVPNQAARQLRLQRANAIGYILPAEQPRFADPFFAELTAGLGDGAAQHGFDLLVAAATASSSQEQELYQRWTHGRKVDGFVLNRIRLHDWRIQYLASIGFPFVGTSRSLDPHIYPTVEVDNRRWFAQLVAHLVAVGHQRIAYIGALPDLVIQAERYQGYQEALQAAGLPLQPELVAQGDLTAQGGYLAARQLLNLAAPPTALACIDDLTALGVLHAAYELGYRVGEDLAVTGFDGIIGFEHTQPPLTTVNQPIYAIARQLVTRLAALIAGENLSDQQVVVEPAFEIRASSQSRGMG